MISPYEVLNVKQDSNKKEILQAKLLAMKEKKYSLNEIHSAGRQLLDPAKRLAADFMFLSKIKSRRPKKITVEVIIPVIETTSIDKDAYDSLN